jgi:N-acetylglutamate synthase-like GNAT family acetyltransferase
MDSLKVRWMNRGDLKSVIKMQKMSGEFSDNHTQDFINKTNAICNVVEVEGKVVGFIFYEIDASSIEIDSLLVEPSLRRRGIGTELLSKLIAKLNKKRREIRFKVSEYDLPSHLLLKKCGFKAIEVIKNSEASDYLFSFSPPIKK